MNKLQIKLAELTQDKKAHKYPALMTHVVLGYPSLAESIEIVIAMSKAGAEIIEMQIPFSDPMADGSTIMYANEQALAAGTTPTDCFKAAKELASAIDTPLLFMTYFNLVYRHKGSVAGFCKDAEKAGIQGLIVPDIGLDNTKDNYWNLAQKYNLSPIPIASPVTTNARLKKIAVQGKHGFVYCVSNTATTGAKKSLPPDLPHYLKKVKSLTKCPIAVGFGISKPEHTKALGGIADIAVVGSATIDLIRQTPKRDRKKRVMDFVAKLAGK